jgi:hypothetical protein
VAEYRAHNIAVMQVGRIVEAVPAGSSRPGRPTCGA